MTSRFDQRRAFTDRILDRLAEDPTYRSQILDNPLTALQAAGFGAVTWYAVADNCPAGAGYANSVAACVGEPPACQDSGPGPSLACFMFSWCL